MIKPFLILNLMLISTVIFAQERFYYLYDGWKINKIAVTDGNYTSFGSSSHPTTDGNLPQFNVFQTDGSPIDSFNYNNDTLEGIYTYRARSYVLKNQALFFACTYTDYNKNYALSPLLINYNMASKDIDTIINYYELFNAQSINFLLDTIFNGFIISGTYIYSANNYFPLLIFTDSTGNAISVKKYNFLPTNPIRRGVFPYQLLKLPDGGYILSCEDEIGQFTSWPDQQRAWFLRLDSQGNELWRRTTAGIDTLCYRPFAFPTQNDDYIITWSDPVLGTAHNLNRTIWLAKMSDSGVITGKHKISDDIEGIENKWYYVNDYYQDSLGNIYLAGESSYAGFLLKINSEGHAVWYREYECFPENDTDGDWDWTKVYGLTPTPDGGFIMGGEYMSPNSAMFPGGIQKGLAIKVDSCGCLEEGCNPLCNVSIGHQFITSEKVSIYPNPSTDLVNLELNTFAKNINIQVFDAEGCLWINTVENSELNDPAKHSLDVSGLAAGFYTVNIWADGKLFSGKFVKIF